MKKLFLIAAVLAAPVYADPADDALLSAQAAYRTALSAQRNNDSKILNLQSGLADAKARLEKAQADITRLQAELEAANTAKAQHTGSLQQAGQQLDSAWNAVYGPGGTRAAQ